MASFHGTGHRDSFGCAVFFVTSFLHKRKKMYAAFVLFSTHPANEAAVAPAVSERAEGRGQAGRRAPYTVCLLIDIGHHRVDAESASDMFFSLTLCYRRDT